MAKTIDEKIVVLEFDNSNFERNTRQSMSTLDKLKEKFNFKGVSHGIDDVAQSIKNVDMSKLSHGIDQVQAKFSALQVVGVTALANITNSALEAGKRIVSAFTIDPIKSGWDKMGQTMGYVQTLKNSTGLSTEKIQEYLDQLMWYSDETSYSFTEMASALASMTATGGDIKKLIPTIMGVANATAYAGKGANEFLVAIRNITQSYSAGYLQRNDWNSLKIQNVNSKQLTQEIIAAGVALGKIKKGEVTIGNFESTLHDKWATTAVMERAFSSFSSLTTEINKAAVQGEYYVKKEGKIVKETYTTASKAIEDFQNHEAALTESDVGKKKWRQISVDALKAAQSAKTFKEAVDATKDATSSAWNNILQTIFGNYDSQLKIFTNLANYLYDLFVEPLNNLHEKIKLAFDFSPIEDLIKRINNSKFMQAFNNVQRVVKKTTKSVETYQKVVAKVWNGDYGNMQKRWNKLEKEGYNSKVVQRLVDLTEAREGYGKGYKGVKNITEEDIIKYEKKYGIAIEETTENLNQKKKALDDLTEAELKEIQRQETSYDKKGNEIHSDNWISDEDIEQFLMLQKSAKKYRMTVDELMKTLTKSKNGARGLLFDAPELDEKNANKLGILSEKKVKDASGKEVEPVIGAFTALLRAFKNVIKIIKDAWHEVFNFNAIDLYMAIDKFNKFANSLYNVTKSEKGMQNLKDTLKGVFSVIKLITTITGGAFKIAFLVIRTVLKTFGYSLLDVLGALGRIVTNIVEFITENNILIDSIVWLVKVIATVVTAVYRFIWNTLHLMDIIRWISDAIHTVAMAIKGFVNDLIFIGSRSMTAGVEFIFKRIGDLFKWLWKSIKSINFTKIWQAIKDVYSKIELRLGELVNNIRKGITYFVQNIWPIIKSAFKTLAVKIYEGLSYILPKIWQWLKEVIPKIFNWLKTNIPKALTWIKDTAKELPYILQNVLKKVTNFISTNMPKLWEIIRKVAIFIKNGLNKLLGNGKNIIDIGKNIVLGLYSGMKTGAKNLPEVVKEIFNKIVTLFKNLFGIHSPSLVMKAIGGYIIAGLIVGMRENNGDIFQTVSDITNGIIDQMKYMIEFIPNLIKTLGNTIIGIIQQMDFGKIMVGVLSIGFVKAALKISDALEIFAKGLSNVNGLIGDVRTIIKNLDKNLQQFAKGAKWRLYGAAFKDMGKALIEIALAIAILTMLDWNKAWRATVLLGGIMALMAIVLGILSGKDSNAIDLSKTNFKLAMLIAVMLGIGLAFKMMASAIATIAKIETFQLEHIIVIAGLIVGFLTAISLISKIPGSKYAAISLLAVGLLFKLMASALKTIGKMDYVQLANGLLGIITLTQLIVELITVLGLVGSFGKDRLTNMAMCIAAMGVLFYLMGKTLKMVGKLDTGQMIRGILALYAMTTMIIGLIAALKFLSGNKTKTLDYLGNTLMKIGVLFILMGITMRILSGLSVGDILKGSFAIALFFAMIAGFMYAIKEFGGKEGQKAERTLIGVAIAILGIAAALILLSTVNPKSLLIPTAIISIILIALGYAVRQISTIGGDALKAIKFLLAILIVMMVGIVALSYIDTNKLINITAGIVGVILSIGILAYTLEKLNKKTKISTFGKLVAKLALLSLALVPIVGIIALLNMIQESNGIAEKALALGIILISLSGAMYILDKIKFDPSIFGSIAGMLVLLVIAAGIVGILYLMNGIQNAIPNAIALSLLLVTLAAVMIPITLVGVLYAATGGAAATGLLGLIALLLITAGFIQILDSFNGINNASRNVKLLTKLLNSLTKVLTKLAIIGPLALIGDVALAGLLIMVKAMIPVVSAMGLLGSLIGKSRAEYILDVGIGIFVKLAEGLGKIIAAFTSALLGGILVNIGRSLSIFMTEIQGFIDGCRNIDENVGYGVKVLVGAILGLTVASFLHAITTLMTMGLSGFAVLGYDLSLFMKNAKTFFDELKTLDSNTLEGAQTLANTMLKIGAANVLNAISEFLGFGTKESLKNFGDQLGALGTGLADFKTNIGKFDSNDVKTVDAAAKAVERLGSAQGNMRTTGGILQFIIGEKESLKDFGSGLADVAKGIRGFITELTKGNGAKKFTKADMEVVESGAEVIKTLADAASNLPETWSLKGWLLGGNQEDLDEFAQKFPTVAAAIRSFIANLTKSGLEKEYRDFVTADGNIAESAKATIIAFKITEDMKPVVEIAVQVLEAIASLSGSIKDVSSESINKVVDLIPVIGQNLKKLIYALLEFDSPVGPNGPVKVDPTKASSLLNKDNMELIKNAVGAFKTICEGLKEILSPNGTNVDASLISIGDSGNDLPDPEDLQGIIDLIPSIGIALRKFIAALTDPNYGLLDVLEQLPLMSNIIKKTVDESEDSSDNTIDMEFITNMVGVFSTLCQALTGFIDDDSDVPDPEDFKEFIETFESIGTNIRKFIDALYNGSNGFQSIAKEFTKDDVTSLSGLFTGVGDLLTTVKEVSNQNEVENSNMKTFFTNLSGFGQNIATFIADSINLNPDEIKKATSNMGLLKSLFDAYITNVIKPATQNLVSNNKESIDALKSEGISFITKFSEGISDQKNLGTLYETIKGKALEASKHLYELEDSIKFNVYQMGVYFIDGFTKGLGDQKAIERMKTQCRNLSSIAESTTKDGLKENSPSKLSMKLGSYFTEGLAIGIGSTANMVYDASSNVGEMAKTGLQEALATMSSVVENDIDAQPTIRPILDLTNVQSGVESMNSMFNNSSIGVLSNLRTVSSEMNSRNQNGRNSDVVSAINKLGNTLSDTPKNTYNINGITYDGDSTVNQAVQQLINAIEIERRV